MSELAKLKKKAAGLWKQANAFNDMSCGRTLAEHIRPEIAIARTKFNEVWKQIKLLDPAAPDNPLV